ncbi:MAG: hypothetical protein J0H74_20815 [Chitinophagaceae bacterium]|nr:hypothetical protein [Chitinophagaceae bacterium]
MRNRTLLLTVVIFFSACDNNSGNVRAGGRSAVDSPARDVYAGKARDTVVRIKSERPADSLEEDPEENLDIVLHRTIAEYRRPFVLDRDGKTILQRTVYKKDFEGLLFPQLDTFDVAVGVTMVIDDHGVVSFNNRSY